MNVEKNVDIGKDEIANYIVNSSEKLKKLHLL